MIKLKETLLLLARSEVDFVIVGGVAATLHGSAFQTFDLDISYGRDRQNLDRLAGALDLGDIDLLGEITGIGGFREVKANSRNVEMYGFLFAILTLSGLIEAKRAAGRDKDLRVLPELEALLEAAEQDRTPWG